MLRLPMDRGQSAAPSGTFSPLSSGKKGGKIKQTARPGLYPERIETVNNMLANLALSKGCYFINTNEFLAGPDGYMKDEYDAEYDGIHLNPTGYRVWGEYLLTHTVWSPRNRYVGENPYYIYGK